MDGEGSSFDGGSIWDTCSGSSPVFGRVLFGVGRSPTRSTRVRGVVEPGEVAAHQSSRDEGTVFGPSVVSRRCHRSSHDSDVRQLDGRGVCQQARGHGFPGSLLVGQPPSEMDGESRHPSRCEVSSRTSQCPGRSPQLSRANCRDRVVSSPSGGEVTASRLGQSFDRPFCDVPQRRGVLFSQCGLVFLLVGMVASTFGGFRVSLSVAFFGRWVLPDSRAFGAGLPGLPGSCSLELLPPSRSGCVQLPLPLLFITPFASLVFPRENFSFVGVDGVFGS